MTETTKATDQTAPSVFLDAEQDLIGIPSAAKVIEDRPSALDAIFAYVPDRGAADGKSALAALAILINQSHIEVFAQDPRSGVWAVSKGGVIFFQHAGQSFGVVQLADSNIARPAAVNASQLFGAMGAAEQLVNERRSQRIERAERQERERERQKALAAAAAEVRERNEALSEHVMRMGEDARKRQKAVAQARLAAKIAGNTAEARAAVTAAVQADMEAGREAADTAKRLREEVRVAEDRYAAAQIEDVHRRNGVSEELLAAVKMDPKRRA